MRSTVPDNVKDYVDRAAQLERQERYDAVIAVYREALALYPHLAVLHNNLGCCLANQGKYAEAKDAFLHAVTLTFTNRQKGIVVPDTYPEEPKQNLLKVQKLLDKGPVKSPPAWTPGAGPWDCFLSYKSDDANVVRRVAERLIAGGFRVWFAEYEVMLQNYDAFAEAIRKGTENSAFGLFFTSQKYAASEWCKQEVDWLRQRLARTPEHLIEIRLEPNNALAGWRFLP
jgi:tetratricopeptide (TPR) repeat protein